MEENKAKVYIVVNKGMIENIFSEDGYMPVVVIDLDEAQRESKERYDEAKVWYDNLRKLAMSGKEELFSIDYFSDADF